ncbi:MAG: ribonuclease Z [Thermoplasmatota archaeon]
MQLYIHFLGTGGSWPSSERNVSSTAIKRGSDLLLFDCGEGTQRQLQKSALSYMQVSAIFITHFHGDHFLGLPGLIQTFQLNDREAPLHVYGPPGMQQVMHQCTHLGYFRPAFEIVAHDLDPGAEVRFPGYRVTCIAARHNLPALSYCLEEDPRPGRFDKPRALELGVPEGPLFGRLQRGHSVQVNGSTITPDMVLGQPRPGRKITLSGDTMPNPALIDFARHSDVLIHDATTDSSLEDKANEYGHSTALQAAQIAREAEVERLYLTHISPRYADPRPLEREAQEIFPESYVAHDFLHTEVKLKK